MGPYMPLHQMSIICKMMAEMENKRITQSITYVNKDVTLDVRRYVLTLIVNFDGRVNLCLNNNMQV